MGSKSNQTFQEEIDAGEEFEFTYREKRYKVKVLEYGVRVEDENYGATYFECFDDLVEIVVTDNPEYDKDETRRRTYDGTSLDESYTIFNGEEEWLTSSESEGLIGMR